MPDPAALRGTRFEFGGRRPRSVPPPRVTYRPPQRPLPGLGTVALGKVTRVAPYGAFVDFLGYRGLVHISQLQPGQRVERVEDVVQEGRQVVVRVIAVDPERRHINLALVSDAAGIMEAVQELPPQAGVSQEPTPSAAAPPAPAPPAAVPPAAQAPPAPAGAPSPLPAAQAVAPPRPAPGPQPPPSRPATAAPAKGAPSPARKAQPKPRQPASQHASRALHREVTDPAHPMARLLAAAGEEALWHQPEAPPQAAPGATGPAGANGPLPAPDPVEEALRPVHVAEPEPEPEQEGPATLEALAARFGPGSAAGPGSPGAGHSAGARSKRDRSREARERQAAILERLRQGAPDPS